MNIDTSKPNVHTLEDRLSHWRAALENARKLGDLPGITRAKEELEKVSYETTLANTEAINELAEARRQEQRIRDFINDDGSWNEPSAPDFTQNDPPTMSQG